MLRYDPSFGHPLTTKYISADQWRSINGTVRWLYNPWTGEKRIPTDIVRDIVGWFLVDPTPEDDIINILVKYPILNKSWARIESVLNIDTDTSAYFKTLLIRLYDGAGRFYHNVDHLANCLTLADSLLCDIEVEIALWFHDAIYVPSSGHNEEASIQLAKQFFKMISWHDGRMQQHVTYLISTTKHDSDAPNTHNAKLMSDIDLAILGTTIVHDYIEYEKNVRLEFSFVPVHEYCTKRRCVMNKFLDRPQIFFTESFVSLNDVAKQNIQLFTIDVLDYILGDTDE